MKIGWAVFLALIIVAPSVNALTPPAPGPTCDITAEVVNIRSVKTGQVETISVDIIVKKAEQIKEGHTAQPSCSSIINTTITNVSTRPFQGTLKNGGDIKATILLYAEGFGNGGLQDISVIDSSYYIKTAVSFVPSWLILIGLVSLVTVAGFLVSWKMKKG